jgi:hypothetical protein
MNRQITEKELKIAARQVRLQHGVIEYLIAKVRENQSYYEKQLKDDLHTKTK